jgi:hypothetical protein
MELQESLIDSELKAMCEQLVIDKVRSRDCDSFCSPPPAPSSNVIIYVRTFCSQAALRKREETINRLIGHRILEKKADERRNTKPDERRSTKPKFTMRIGGRPHPPPFRNGKPVPIEQQEWGSRRDRILYLERSTGDFTQKYNEQRGWFIEEDAGRDVIGMMSKPLKPASMVGDERKRSIMQPQQQDLAPPSSAAPDVQMDQALPYDVMVCICVCSCVIK